MQKALSRFSALTSILLAGSFKIKKALLSIESKAGNVKISRKRIRSLYLIWYVHYPASPFLEGFTANNKGRSPDLRTKALTVAGPRWFFHQTSLFTQSLN